MGSPSLRCTLLTVVRGRLLSLGTSWKVGKGRLSRMRKTGKINRILNLGVVVTGRIAVVEFSLYFDEWRQKHFMAILKKVTYHLNVGGKICFKSGFSYIKSR